MNLTLLLHSSVESLRCHADDENTDPEIVPADSTLQTLLYVSSFLQVMLTENTSGTGIRSNACVLALNRQRKERQDLKASKKFVKNRHDLYADELVGC